MSTDEPKPRPDFAPRPIRSYVLRTGRMTPGQEKALREEWSRYGVDAPAQPLSSAGLFARQAPITLEVGFGMGDSLFATAASQPERNFIGVEVHKPGVGHLLHLAAKTGLDNLRVFHDDSLAVLEQYLQPGELDTLQIFFPDPWHKKRHHKRRLLNDEFMMLALRQLRPGGILHVATDWVPYGEQVLETVARHPGFEPVAPPARLPTKYEQRGLRLGHEVMDLAWRSVDQQQ